MKIYTKTGDKGKTSLFGGTRVEKDTRRIEAYGSVDELNSQIGVVRSLNPPGEIDKVLSEIQNDLFVLGADLATPAAKQRKKMGLLEARHVENLERTIDHMDGSLEPLTKFILPGGSRVGAELHRARTVCRRTERVVVGLLRKGDIGTTPFVYLNRLSDLLFVLARYANKLSGVGEVQWTSNNSR
ncbi:MAG TPA: cob(I)yrinic acid a,c-diamide adenosyltransferase [Bacteroidota bacterium]|nr:cob(I)yrinic acid a,c-diamide adenosyltransferase [Bacteroidota bacterium]